MHQISNNYLENYPLKAESIETDYNMYSKKKDINPPIYHNYIHKSSSSTFIKMRKFQDSVLSYKTPSPILIISNKDSTVFDRLSKVKERKCELDTDESIGVFIFHKSLTQSLESLDCNNPQNSQKAVNSHTRVENNVSGVIHHSSVGGIFPPSKISKDLNIDQSSPRKRLFDIRYTIIL